MPESERYRNPYNQDRYRGRSAERYEPRRSSGYYPERNRTLSAPPNEEEEPPPTFSGQVQLFKINMKKLNKIIEGAFPESPDDIAYKLVRVTPRAITVCYVLLATGILASRFNLLWAEGYLWGIASLSVIMIGVFLWIWSSNVMKFPNLSEKARRDLKSAMRLQSTSFIVAVLTIVYFLGMALNFW
jgi:hypothetical protein